MSLRGHLPPDGRCSVLSMPQTAQRLLIWRENTKLLL